RRARRSRATSAPRSSGSSVARSPGRRRRLDDVRTARRLPHVDRVAVEERVSTLAKRSIKTDAKQQGIRLAVSMLDLTTLAGADFIKTSTGKAKQGATPGVVLVMLEALRDYVQRTGRIVGMKPAGGVSTSKQALHMLVLVKETLGDDWLTPERFRIGASSVLNDLLMQYEKALTGRYGRAEDFSKE